MNEDDFRRRSWVKKFRDAFRGARQGVRGQGSFFVHVFCAAAVALSAMALRVERVEWCVLVLCITIVLAAEMFNSAIEAMARAIDTRATIPISATPSTSAAPPCSSAPSAPRRSG